MKKIILLFFLLVTILSISTAVQAQKILILGDSHYAGTFGQELDKLLKDTGNQIESYGCVSAQPSWYLTPAQTCKKSQGSTISGVQQDYSAPQIDTLIEDSTPQIILISLGGNPAGPTPSSYSLTITSLTTKIKEKNIKCYWIGPPGKTDPAEKSERDLRYQAIQNGIKDNCILIDSRELVKLNKDEVHFSDTTRPKDWAQKVFQQFKQLQTAAEFVGPPISAMETDDEKKTYQDFEAEPPQVDDASIPKEVTTTGFISSDKKDALSAQQLLQQIHCDDPQRCQNIDEVWYKRIGIYINQEHAQHIWDPRTTSWKTYQETYVSPPPQPSPSQTSTPTTTLPIDEASLSKKIQQEKAAGKYDDAFLAKVNQIANNLNTKPEYLIAVMRFETGGTFDPCKKSKYSTATGLIQFLKSTAVRLDTTTDQLCKMIQVQQLDYVEKYFNQFKHKIRPNNLGDIAMAVIWPKAIGKDDNYVLFKQPSSAYNANAALDYKKNGGDDNGEITKAEYLNLVIKKM